MGEGSREFIALFEERGETSLKGRWLLLLFFIWGTGFEELGIVGRVGLVTRSRISVAAGAGTCIGIFSMLSREIIAAGDTEIRGGLALLLVELSDESEEWIESGVSFLSCRCPLGRFKDLLFDSGFDETRPTSR